MSAPSDAGSPPRDPPARRVSAARWRHARAQAPGVAAGLPPPPRPLRSRAATRCWPTAMRRPSRRWACSPCCSRWPARPTWPICCRWWTACCSRVRRPMWRRRASAPPRLPTDLLDPRRDALTMALVPAAIDSGTPMFGVCRGLQEMNVALGGSLHQQLHSEPGLMDHREPDDPRPGSAVRHAARGAPGARQRLRAVGRRHRGDGELAARAGHQAAGRTAWCRKRCAPDGLVEGVRVADAAPSPSACSGIPNGATRATPSTRGRSRPSRRPVPSTGARARDV